MSKYSEWNRGQDEALLNKLGGMEIALKLLDCRKVTVTFDTGDKRATITADAPVMKVCNPKLVSVSFDPAQFIGSDWRIWRGSLDGDGREGAEDQDDRALAVADVDFSKVRFEASLKKGETRITGEEKLQRLKASGDIRFGGNQFLALWLDYQERGENSVLEWLRKTQSVTYLDFFGSILRDPRGYRYVLCLGWDDGRWGWHYGWLGDDWYAGYPAAVGSAS